MVPHRRSERDTRCRETAVRSSGLRSLPSSARAFLISIDVIAAAVTGVLLLHETVTATLLVRFVVLLGLCVGYAEVGARSQRITRYLSSGKVFTNPMSVWSFAALLVLPAGWASLFIAGQYAHSMLQRRRERSGNSYRVVFTAAVTMTAQLATAAVLAAGGASGHALHGSVVGGLVTALGVPVFVAVNLALLVAGMWLAARPPSLRPLIPGADTLTTEATTLLLGIVAAELLMHSPVLLPITLVFIATLQRSSTVKALHQTARTDAKTGLLTSAAWTASVQNVLARLGRSGGGDIAVLLIDLDHFKLINDEHGHLVGDRVLAAVGACLQRELRERDAVCRFGGEEFAAVLAGPGADEAVTVAERVCAALREVRVDEVSFTASVGLAHDRAGRTGVTVEALLAGADAALYAAKRQGRNQVRASGLVAH